MTRPALKRFIDKLIGIAVAAVVCVGLMLAASCTCVPSVTGCPHSYQGVSR